VNTRLFGTKAEGMPLQSTAILLSIATDLGAVVSHVILDKFGFFVPKFAFFSFNTAVS
jgi:uncharacterized membrane protein YeaQ/YmgE (transglycosylase-associated protein family)